MLLQSRLCREYVIDIYKYLWYDSISAEQYFYKIILSAELELPLFGIRNLALCIRHSRKEWKLMKKLLAPIVSAAVLLSACPIPSFAEEILTETGDAAGQTETTDTAAETAEEPADPTPEELQAAEFEALKERVAEGLRILEERQKECSELTEKHPDLEATQERWSAFFAEQTDQFTIPFQLIADYIDKLNKGEAEPVDFSNEEELMARVQAEIDTNLNTPDEVQIIPRTIIAPYITEIVQKSMPKEEFDKMCADPLHYRLCFLDGAFGCLRIDDETEFVQQIVFMPERMDLIPCAEVATKLHYAFKNSGDFRTEAAAAAFKGLAAIAYMRNTEIELLKEINWEMTGMGHWNVSDDTVTVGVKPERPSEIPMSQAFNTVTSWFYDLFAGDDVYTVPGKDVVEKPVYAVIRESAGNNCGNDTLFFDYAVTPDQIQLIRSEDNLYINDLKNERYIFIPDEFSSNIRRIENIKFKDGTVLDYEEILWRVNYFIGMEEADEYTGYPEINRIFGNDGDDKLTGLSGTSYILGYGGNDTIKAGSLSPIFNEGGPHYLYGMDGDDTLTGGGNQDFLYGGKDDDLMIGGPQNDLFYYALGDGNDTVDETTGRGTYPYDGYDVLWLGKGIKPDEVRVTFSETEGTYAFVLHMLKTGETVTLPGNMYSGVSPVFPINAIFFEDGTKWNRQKLLELTCDLYGTEEDDKITVLTDGDAAFWKEYSGNVKVQAFGGNDTVIGSGQSNSIYGGKGDDYLNGCNGDDIYYYNVGDGDDTIDEQKGRGSYPYGGHDTVVFGEGIQPDEVTVVLSMDQYSFTLCFDKVGGSITMPGNQISGFTNIFPIEEFRFADGTVWNGVQELIDRQVFRGTDGDDVFSDTREADTIYCGKGNDTIRGTTGDDTFIYNYGDGFDKLTDYSIWADSDDTLRFGADIKPEEIYAEKLGDYHTLYVRDLTGSVSIFGIENIVFADGTAWKTSELPEKAKSADEIRPQIKGDANGDGKVSIADLVCVQKYLFGSGILPNYAMADCNDDGKINALDISCIKRILIA